MSIPRRAVGVFIIALIMTCVWLPGTAFSETKRAGYYAGPLSAATEIILEPKVQEPAVDENHQQVEGEPQAGASEKAGGRDKKNLADLDEDKAPIFGVAPVAKRVSG